MDISQLQYFLKIVEHRNFTRAAEDCFVSQSAISQQIAKLEQELGQPVFERQARKISLTPAGELLQKRASQILALVNDTKNEITDNGTTGRLVISAIPTIAPFFLPALLSLFHEKYPLVEIEVNEDETKILLKRCNNGEIDLGILALPVETKHLDTLKLFEEELLLVLPTGHPLTQQKKISLADISKEPFVLLTEAHCLTGHVTEFCHQQAFQPVKTGRTNQIAMVLELVGLGHGVSVVPAMVQQRDPSNTREYRSFSGIKPTREVAVCWNPYCFQSQIQKNFITLLKQTTS